MGSFTYLFKPLNSTSTLPGESDQLEFTNVLGKFKGIWKNDFIYLTDDRLMNFRMDFLEITEKDTKFQCDGVLGLGYSFSQSYGNIYDVLAKMYNVVPSKKVMSYDKKNKILTIGEFPGPQFTNPHKFKLEYENIESKIEEEKLINKSDSQKEIEAKLRDTKRKNDLAQIQTAIITSQMDK